MPRDADELFAWDVLERSKGGHERRRRLPWIMSRREAQLWSAQTSASIEEAAMRPGLGRAILGAAEEDPIHAP